MINVLRFIYALLPIGVFILWTMSPQKAGEIKAKVDTVQGSEGWVVFNKPDHSTVGDAFGGAIKSIVTDPSPEVEFYIGSICRDTDRIVYFTQDNWVWILCALVFLTGLVVVLLAKPIK